MIKKPIVRNMKLLAAFGIFLIGFSGFSPAYAEGSCSYSKAENLFAKKHKACRMPMNQEQCGRFGINEGVMSLIYSDDECAIDEAIGSCSLGDITVYYYSGDVKAEEIRCNYRGGKWSLLESPG